MGGGAAPGGPDRGPERPDPRAETAAERGRDNRPGRGRRRFLPGPAGGRNLQVSVFPSDVTAAVDRRWPGRCSSTWGIPLPEDEELHDQVLPAGDLSIFADLGVDEMELGALSGDLDLFPDEVLASLAARLGFGQGDGACPRVGARVVSRIARSCLTTPVRGTSRPSSPRCGSRWPRRLPRPGRLRPGSRRSRRAGGRGGS